MLELVPLGTGWSIRSWDREILWIDGLPVKAIRILAELLPKLDQGRFEDGRSVGYEEGFQDGQCERPMRHKQGAY